WIDVVAYSIFGRFIFDGFLVSNVPLFFPTRRSSDLHVQPQVVFQSQSPEAIRSMVAFQRGITILSDLVYRPWSLEGRRVLRQNIAQTIPTMDIGCVWATDRPLSPAIKSFIQFLENSIKMIGHS